MLRKRTQQLEQEIENLREETFKQLSAFADNLLQLESSIQSAKKSLQNIEKDVKNQTEQLKTIEDEIEQLKEPAVTKEDLEQLRKHVNALVSGVSDDKLELATLTAIKKKKRRKQN